MTRLSPKANGFQRLILNAAATEDPNGVFVVFNQLQNLAPFLAVFGPSRDYLPLPQAFFESGNAHLVKPLPTSTPRRVSEANTPQNQSRIRPTSPTVFPRLNFRPLFISDRWPLLTLQSRCLGTLDVASGGLMIRMHYAGCYRTDLAIICLVAPDVVNPNPTGMMCRGLL